MKKLFVIHPELVAAAGHVYTESQAWRRLCQARGITLRLFGHRDCDPNVVKELGVEPVFGLTDEIAGRYMSAAERLAPQPADVLALTDFTLRGECMKAACEAAWASEETPPDLLVFPWVDAALVDGIAAWLAGVKPERRPRMLLNFVRPEPGWTADAGRDLVNGDFSYFRFATRRLRALAHPGQVALTAVEPRLCRLVSELAQMDCHPAPLHQYYPDPAPQPAANPDGRVRIAFLGPDRPQKGGSQMADLIARICRIAPTARVFAQVTTRARADEIASAAAGVPTNAEIDLHIGGLSTEAYFQRLAETDLLVQPYEAAAYALMPSGIFADAAAVGVPVVTPGDTWMADRLTEGWSAGAIFHEAGSDAVIAAVYAALERLPTLQLNAVASTEAWRKAHSLEAYVETSLPLLDLTLPAAAKPTAKASKAVAGARDAGPAKPAASAKAVQTPSPKPVSSKGADSKTTSPKPAPVNAAKAAAATKPKGKLVEKPSAKAVQSAPKTPAAAPPKAAKAAAGAPAKAQAKPKSAASVKPSARKAATDL
ncbi:MAG: glycosyltransferase [Proteobacteria bacterium]|nr:glycosyltransferase [Pseudomonadota bacterium]